MKEELYQKLCHDENKAWIRNFDAKRKVGTDMIFLPGKFDNKKFEPIFF